MKSLHQTYHIKAPKALVWQALVDPKIIDAWGGGPVTMDDKEGTKFSLWGGDIHGTTTKVIPEKELAQDWFGGKWDEPSHVTFRLLDEGGVTTVELDHTHIPDKELQDIADGWKSYYMGPLQDLLEK